MKIPPTQQVPGIPHAIAVWVAEDGSTRYWITHGPAPATEWKDARDGWAPFKLSGDAHAAAYMACRDADPHDTYHTLRKALNAAKKAAEKAHRQQLRRAPAA